MPDFVIILLCCIMLLFFSLQEALQERETQIQALLEERDFERNEVASATSQVSKVNMKGNE